MAKQPNQETINVIEKAERGEEIKEVRNASELLKELNEPNCEMCNDTGEIYKCDKRYKSVEYAPPEAITTLPCPACKPEQCKHNWAKKGKGKVCIECGEQPNTELLIVKTIQQLMHVVNNELDKLRINIEYLSCHRPHLVRKALEEIDLFEKTTLELQKAFE